MMQSALSSNIPLLNRSVLLAGFALLAIIAACSHIASIESFHSGLLGGIMATLALVCLLTYTLLPSSLLISVVLWTLFAGLSLGQFLHMASPPGLWSAQAHLSLLVHIALAMSLLVSALWQPQALPTTAKRLIPIVGGILFLSIVIGVWMSDSQRLLQTLLAFIGICVFHIALGLYRWRQHQTLGLSYALGWSVGIVAVAIQIMQNSPLSANTGVIIAWGLGISCVALGFVLDVLYRHYNEALLLSQPQDCSEHEDETEALEYKVQERTLELEIALRELSEKNQQLEEKNTLDALTGIRNRHYFDKKYQAELRRSRREQTQLSLAMLDIDHFKQVNDTHGHLVGDECIKTVADLIQQALKRPSDEVCRYGGEEFAIILPNTELEGATALLDDIRSQIEQAQIDVESSTISITVSAGVATTVATLSDQDQALLALADKQLYQAKHDGRNQVCASVLAAQPE